MVGRCVVLQGLFISFCLSVVRHGSEILFKPVDIVWPSSSAKTTLLVYRMKINNDLFKTDQSLNLQHC